MSVKFNFRNASQEVVSGQIAECDASASIITTTDAQCTIQITATGKWYYTSKSGYYVISPGVLTDFTIDSETAGSAVNLFGNAAPIAASLDHIKATTTWGYDSGYAKFWDSSKNTYTIVSDSIIINRTTSTQTINWSATFFPSMDNVKKHDTGWTISGTISVPALPTYTITYSANGHGTAPATQTKTYGEDLTLQNFIADHNANSYAVSFQANGGSSTPATITSTKTYAQNYWNTKSDGTGTNYSSGGKYANNNDATLYAIWNSGTQNAITLPTAMQCTRTGYELLGWATNSSATSATYNPGATYTPTSTITLYAVWKPSGTVRIWDGSSWVLALPFIYTEAKGWVQAIPYAYVNDTDKWKLCGG